MQAKQKLVDIVGPNNYLDHEATQERYETNTIGHKRELLGAILVSNAEEIPRIMAVAQEYKIHIYPISTGKNWGYGSSLPVINHSIIMDLSRLNKIIEFNPQLGYVVVEPGVTQQMLYDFIKAQNLNYMVPTTGAGPNVSILANALERGYGMTPVEDHTNSLLGLKAYLPDGSLYESQLKDFGGFRSDRVFKWKIGPNLDGLFAQSNLGIVFQATIGLAVKPGNVTQFLAFINDDSLEDAINIVRRLKSEVGSVIGGINIMNRRRLLSMVSETNEWSTEFAANELFIRNLAKKQNLPDWVVMGGIYGPDEVVDAVKKNISKEFTKITNKTIFLSRQKVNLLKNILRFIPISRFKKVVKGLDNAINILEGQPAQVALQLAYLKNPVKPSEKAEILSPDRDNCGLIWFSPILPMDANLVRDFTSEVIRICLYYDIDPLITLTSVSERCFDSTIPILFNKNDPSHIERARKCHETLLAMSQEMGLFPYRLDVRSMEKIYLTHQGVASKLWDGLKAETDPNGILSRGRYHRSN